jgi:phage baseplate assembly protein W
MVYSSSTSQITSTANSSENTGTAQIYKGFSTLSSNKSNMLYDIDVVKQDLINHFYTRKGERVMEPEFGSIIWDLLYEPLDESVKEDLIEDCSRIINTDPRCELLDINLDSFGNGIRVDISINVLPFNKQATMQLEFERETL